MYRTLHFFCIVSCLLYYCTIFSDSVFSKSNDWLSFNSKQDSNSLIKINITESTNHNLRFRLIVPGAMVLQRAEKEQQYQILNIPGCLPINNIGKPQLPRLIKCIAIPASCTIEDIDILIVSHEFRYLEGYEIAPVPKQIKRKTSNDVIYFEEEYLKDKEIYSANRFYPNELLQIEKIGFIRDQKVMWLSINPVQYNPVINTLKTFSSIEVYLTFNGDIIFGKNSLGPFDQVRENLLLNDQFSIQNFTPYPMNSGHVSYPINLLDQSNSADYLVITTDDLITNTSLDSFAHHKANFNGFNVAVVKNSDIYQQFPDTTHDASIKDFLVYAFYHWQSPYFADNHLGYVLLVGEGEDLSDNVIPIHKMTRYQSERRSDHWYACVNDDDEDGRITENDYIADFIIGRFSVENHHELATITQKTINYELNLHNGDSWRKKISLVSGFAEGGDNSVKVLFDELETMTLEQNYYEIVSRLHRSEMNPSYVRNSFIQQLNNGCAIVDVCAHGNVDVWGDAQGWILFRTSDIYSLDNNDRQPIILSFACNTADISDSLQDCLGETFLNVPNRGAIAFWGATSPVGLSDFVIQTVYENLIIRQNTSLGVSLYLAHFLGSNYHIDYIILGDPALNIHKQTDYLPDLSISPDDISIDWSPVMGCSDTIVARVTNIGPQPVKDVCIRFFNGNPMVDGFQIGTDNIIGSIDRFGDYQIVESPIEDITGDEIAVFVQIDPYNQIHELDETNNVASILAQEPDFVDVAPMASIADTSDSWATAFGDYNDDNLIDIFVVNWPQPDVLYKNKGNYVFDKIILQADILNRATWDYSFKTTFIDFDNDGDLDIYLYSYAQVSPYAEEPLGWEELNVFHRNDGDDIFTPSKIFSEDGKAINDLVLGFFDFNQDGLIDMLCSKYTEGPWGGKNLVLYQSNPNGYYSDVSSAMGLESRGGSVSVSFGDYDNDGYVDFIAGGLFKNIVNDLFVDVTVNAGLKGLEYNASFCDYNNDGYLDIFGRDYVEIESYRNNKDGTFTNNSSATGLDSMAVNLRGQKPTLTDYNNDGYQDLYNPYATDFYYQDSESGTFVKDENVVEEKGEISKAGSAVGDYDNDGDIDLYIAVYERTSLVNRFEKTIPPANVLYRNNGNSNNWLSVKLYGTESNFFGIGSRVRVVAGSLVQIRDVTCEAEGFIQNSLPLEFGLGENFQIDTVEVRWPSGVKDVFTNLDVNQIITIKEGSGDYSVHKVYTYQLTQNFPNPFNTTTNFLYSIASNTQNAESSVEVTIRIYNMLGQKVRTMVLGWQKAGQHAFKWDGRNDNNVQLPSGIYFYQIQAGEFVQTKKMLLLK